MNDEFHKRLREVRKKWESQLKVLYETMDYQRDQFLVILIDDQKRCHLHRYFPTIDHDASSYEGKPVLLDCGLSIDGYHITDVEEIFDWLNNPRRLLTKSG